LQLTKTPSNARRFFIPINYLRDIQNAILVNILRLLMKNRKKQVLFTKGQNRLKILDPEITVSVSVDVGDRKTFPKGFVDRDKLDATTEVEIELHKREDDEQARLDALNKNA
jgi:hypothetical protein